MSEDFELPSVAADAAPQVHENPQSERHGREAPDALVKFLEDAARYFEARPTLGEDMAHWANVYNAENCRKAAARIKELEAVVVAAQALADFVWKSTDVGPVTKGPHREAVLWRGLRTALATQQSSHTQVKSADPSEGEAVAEGN